MLDCFTNTAHVAWQASSGANFYIVQAFGEKEYESGCETDSQSCLLTELTCGITYNISVIAVNNVCNVSQSAVTQVKAGEDNRHFTGSRVNVCATDGADLIRLTVYLLLKFGEK